MLHPDSSVSPTVARWEKHHPAGFRWECGCMWDRNGEQQLCAEHVAARQQAGSRYPRPVKPGVNAICSKRGRSGSLILRHDEFAHRCLEVAGHPGWCIRYEGGGGPTGVDSSTHVVFYGPVEPGHEQVYEDLPVEAPEEVRKAFFDSGKPEPVSTYFG